MLAEGTAGRRRAGGRAGPPRWRRPSAPGNVSPRGLLDTYYSYINSRNYAIA